tara:strand:+ start:974 stop:1393 length:420 start_codon:yes stop_codon:yes gene_type:complete
MTDETLFVNLKVLAQLQPYQRINTRHLLFVVHPIESNPSYTSIFTHVPEWLKRWYEGSTRDSDFSRIRDMINKALKELQNTKIRDKLIVHLNKSIVGLENLKKTYESDLTYQCRIITLIETIKEAIGEYNVSTALMDER